MAKLINNLLGKIKGTLGDITFFQRGNEQHIKPRKLRHRKSKYNSEKAKDNRSKFSQSHYFAKNLKLQHEIAAFWKSMKVNGKTPYFKIHGYNRMKCTVDSLTKETGITPVSISISVENLLLKRNTLSFSYKLFRTSDEYLKPPYKLFIVAYLNLGFMSRKVHKDSLHFLTTDIEVEDTEFTNVNITFLNTLSDVDIPALNKLYFFIAAVKTLPEINNFEWSSSFVKAFDVSSLGNKWFDSIEIK